MPRPACPLRMARHCWLDLLQILHTGAEMVTGSSDLSQQCRQSVLRC